MTRRARPVVGADVDVAALAGVKRERLPDFLGIGMQKAGTTWLWENLRRHPEIYLPSKKELHFFDRPAGRTLSDYARAFARARGRVKGEITPAYGSLPTGTVRFVRAVMPDLRLVLLLRDPIDRAWSQVVMELARRRGRDVSELRRREIVAFLRSDASVSRSRIVPILDAWGEAFGDGLFVGFFDDVVARPKQLLSAVFRHLGVSRRVDWSTMPVDRVIVPRLSRGRFARAVPAARLGEETSPPCPAGIERVIARNLEADLREVARRLGGPARRWHRRAQRAQSSFV